MATKKEIVDDIYVVATEVEDDIVTVTYSDGNIKTIKV